MPLNPGIVASACELADRTRTGDLRPQLDGIITSANTGDEARRSFVLQQNYPNPFNSKTIITFEMANEEHAVLEIYNVLGERVITLLDKQLTPGLYDLVFDASQCASGIYLYRLTTGSFNQQKRMLFLK